MVLLMLQIDALDLHASPSNSFTVNSTIDAIDLNPGDGLCQTASNLCTLRAAIQEANVQIGKNIINLPSGNYKLTIPGANEDLSKTGDLDITDDLEILGNDPSNTLIDGNKLDRVVHILSSNVTFNKITIENGESPDRGGGISATGYPSLTHFTLSNSIVQNNKSYGDGGGIINNGYLTITHSIIQSNTTVSGDGGFGLGGGVYSHSWGPMTPIDEPILIIDNSIVRAQYSGFRECYQRMVRDCTYSKYHYLIKYRGHK